MEVTGDRQALARQGNVLHDGDPETSHEAAATVTQESITLQQNRILAVLDELVVATDFQIARRYRRDYPEGLPTEQSLRSRRAQLVARGLVEFTGEFGTSPSGNRSRLWRRVPTGGRLF